MRILMLAPHPFYQDRGTPIAVDLILRVLSDRGNPIDVVTYHEGRDVHYKHITLYRIPKLPLVHRIRPGFSWKKFICDMLMFFVVIRLVVRKKYHIVHAVEESVFIALALKWLLKIPYVYDMDSSLAQQMVEKHPGLSHVALLLNYCEAQAVKNAKAVVPVCDALADVVKQYKPEKVLVLHDVSLLTDSGPTEQGGLKAELGISGLILMYVGNLEEYQGIDLLLESFVRVVCQEPLVNLVIIGGERSDIRKYAEKAQVLGIDRKVHFLGTKPIDTLATYLAQADILVSPRIKGQNTPMKLYSYLHSGKAIVATDLPTHTQVLSNETAVLTEPVPEAYAKGLLRLIGDETIRYELGMAGKRQVEEKFGYPAFSKKWNGLYDWLSLELTMTRATSSEAKPFGRG